MNNNVTVSFCYLACHFTGDCQTQTRSVLPHTRRILSRSHSPCRWHRRHLPQVSVCVSVCEDRGVSGTVDHLHTRTCGYPLYVLNVHIDSERQASEGMTVQSCCNVSKNKKTLVSEDVPHYKCNHKHLFKKYDLMFLIISQLLWRNKNRGELLSEKLQLQGGKRTSV